MIIYIELVVHIVVQNIYTAKSVHFSSCEMPVILHLFYIIINPLTSEFPEHGVSRPGAPRHNITFNSFFKISKPIFCLQEYIKDLQASISALWEYL